MQPSKKISALLLALGLVLSGPLHAQNYNSYQNSLIGVTPDLQAKGLYGKGVVFAVIDTGIVAPWIGFQGRVSNKSVCIYGCGSAFDDNGHGTFVASQIVGNVPGKFMGIATQGTVMGIKALAANGSGMVGDVANGITYAANNGAKILNLSLTFVPTSQLISAINSAAAQGAVVVCAGGNDGGLFQKGATISGLTDKAIQNLLLVGSTNAAKTASFFSTKPGSGGFTSTSGKYYSYASRWVMADGEQLYGASNYNGPAGYSYVTMMTGTSMAAPQASGVAGLLAARWPFLLNNGTVAQIMLATTQDLGATGLDSIYGSGFLRADKAFQPVGTLTVPVNGTYIPVSQAQLQANGSINSAAIKAALAKGVAYDNYKRDFSMNLSSGIGNGNNNNATQSVYGRTAGTNMNGRSFTQLGMDSWLVTSFASGGSTLIQPSAALNRGGFMQDPTRVVSDQWSVGFYANGTYLGAGSGTSSAYSFNEARWGSKNAFFDTGLAGAGSLTGLSTGAGYATSGFDLGEGERLSFGFIMGKDNTQTMLMGNEVSTQGFVVGYTVEADKDLDVSFTGSFMKEKNALMGAASGGYLRMGEDASSMAVGFSANYDLGDGLQVGIDTTAGSTDASENPNSLITRTSRLYSAGYGVALRKDNVTGVGDILVASIKSPLHVLSGSADLDVPVGADENGDPIIERERVNLGADGMELNFGLGYTRPMGDNTTGTVAFEFRKDADNIPGAIDHAVMFRLTKNF